MPKQLTVSKFVPVAKIPRMRESADNDSARNDSARNDRADSGAGSTSKTAKRRLVGIDVARGIAVLGMFAAHFDPNQLDTSNWLHQLVAGRSAALFALLAGVSVALISGGQAPRERAALRVSRVHIAVRALLLFLLGLALTSLGTPVKEILTVYAVLFLLAIPLLRVRPVILAAVAAVLAAAGPVLSFVLRSTVVTRYRPAATPSFDDLGTWHSAGEVLKGLLLTGPYPVLTWLPFLLAGMAIGRLDLRSAAVRIRLLLAGLGLAVSAYGASWLWLNAFGGYGRIAETLRTDVAGVRTMADNMLGLVPTGDPEFLVTAASHSGAPLEIIAAIGLGMVIISGSLFLADRFRRSCTPLASIGALALTSYAGHILVIYAIQSMVSVGSDEELVEQTSAAGYLPLLVLIGVTAILTTVWRRYLGRGPLEWGLHGATKAAGALVKR